MRASVNGTIDIFHSKDILNKKFLLMIFCGMTSRIGARFQTYLDVDTNLVSINICMVPDIFILKGFLVKIMVKQNAYSK